MSQNSKPEMTHSYLNLKTKYEIKFGFVKTQHAWLFDLIAEDGRKLGEWNKKSRLYQMEYGLSNYLIRKLDTEK